MHRFGSLVLRFAGHALVFLLCFSGLADRADAAQTVGPHPIVETLSTCACILPGMPSELLAINAVDTGLWQDDTEFVVAFWTSLDYESKTPLHVVGGNRRTGSWRHLELPVERDIDRSEIESVKREAGFVFIYLKNNYEDYAIPVLTSGLESLGTLYGLIRRVLPNGLIEYQLHQPHFAPHWVRIGVFDPRTKTDREVYPPARCEPVRCEYADRFLAAQKVNFDDSRQRELGRRELEASETAAPEVVNWDAKAFAFIVTWEQFHDVPAGWTEIQKVVVTCDGLSALESIACHETPIEAWRKLFPLLDDAAIAVRAAAEPRKVQ